MAECLASAFRWPGLERLAVYAFPRGAAAGGAGAKQPAHVFPDPEPVRALLTASRVGTLHVKIELPGAERARLRAAVPRPDEAHRRDHAACQGRLPAILLQRPRAVVPGTRVPAPRVVLRRRLRPVRGGSAAVVEAPGADPGDLQLRGSQARQRAEPREAGRREMRSALVPYCGDRSEARDHGVARRAAADVWWRHGEPPVRRAERLG